MPSASLAVWTFDTASGAEVAATGLGQLAARQVVTVVDVATVSWAKDATRPTVQPWSTAPEPEALGPAFWGLLFGLVFFVPLLGAALGTPVGGVPGSLADVGIDDTFVNKVRDRVTPGTSALFVLTTDDVTDGISEVLAPNEPAALVFTRLTEEQAAALREVFANA
jgi:uncharacterized membrane protein